MNRHATPIAEGWDAASNPHTYVVTAAQKKVERNANNNGNPQIIRALQGFSRTNGYPTVEFSIEIRNRQGGAVCVGVTTASAIANVNRALGADNMSWAYWANEGRILTNNANVHGGLRPAESGAVVVIRLDRNANTVTFFLRGEQGLDQLGLPVSVAGAGDAELFPAVSFINNTAEARLFYKLPFRLTAISQPAEANVLQNIQQAISRFPSKKRIHMAVFGRYGVGKSALVQTIITALLNDNAVFWHTDLVTRPSQDHVTTVLNRFRAETDEVKEDEKGIDFWDTWGWMENAPVEFADVFLPKILKGLLAPGVKMPKSPTELADLDSKLQIPPIPMDTAIIVISFAEFGVDNGNLPAASLARLLKVVQTCRVHFKGQDPVVVLSHCDLADIDLVEHPDNVWTNPRVVSAVVYLSTALEMQPTNIYPVVLTYGTTNESNDAINRSVLHPLASAIRQARLNM